MTRKPRKSRSARKAPRKMPRRARKPAKAAKPTRPDPLDVFVAAGARSLNLKIAKAWLPAVRGHLKVTLRLGGLVTGFVLADEAEPAPVFKA